MDEQKQERELKLARAKKNMLKAKITKLQNYWNPIMETLILEDGTTISREYLEDNGLSKHIPERKNLDR